MGEALYAATAAGDEIDRAADATLALGVAEFAGAALRERAQDAPFVRGHTVGPDVRVEAGAQDRAEFAAHDGVAGGLTGAAGVTVASRSSGLGSRPSRPAVTWR